MMVPLLLVACTTVMADWQVLLFMEGADGSVEIPGHEGWVALESVDHDISGFPADLTTVLDHPPAVETGRMDAEELEGRTVLLLTKELDKSSVHLLSESGQLPEDVELVLLTPGGSTCLTLNFQGIRWTRVEEVGEDLEVYFTADALEWRFYPDAR